MSIDTSDAIAGAAEADANARAKAIAIGAKWKCSRVRQWVGLDDCVKRYAEARDNGQYAPCLECSSILRSLREMGCATPVNTKAPVSTEPRQEPKKIISPIPKEKPMAPKPVAKKKEVASTPAKKGTPDPVMEEVKAVVETKAEIVTPDAPEVKEKAESFTNPFAGDGWTKYDPKARYIEQSDDFATLTGSVLQFSSKTTQENGLREYASVDLHYRDGRIGCVFHRDERGVLKVRPDGNGRVVFSAQGFARAHKIPQELFSKRAAVVVHAPGVVEVNLKSEVAA